MVTQTVLNRRFHWRQDQGRWKLTWDGIENLTLDACFRPVTSAHGGQVYLRGLDGRLLRIHQHRWEGHSFREAETLSEAEKEQWFQLWSQRLACVLTPGRPWLESLREDELAFRRAYPDPVSILPPDRYRSLVLQLTRGCSWNRCHFCNLYQDRPYQVRSRQQFERHLEQVKAYFGEALSWRQGVFLGEANAGNLSLPRLLVALESISRHFPQFARQVALFQDTFSGKLRPSGEWRILKEAGLQQVNLGVESGSQEILDRLNKPAQVGRLPAVIENCKGAGLHVSAIFMLGVGGREGASLHEAETLRLLRSLPLERGDRVYFSELLIHPGRPYAKLSATPMSRLECRLQLQRIREALAWKPAPVGPYLSLYDVRQFTYH